MCIKVIGLVEMFKYFSNFNVLYRYDYVMFIFKYWTIFITYKDLYMKLKTNLKVSFEFPLSLHQII